MKYKLNLLAVICGLIAIITICVGKNNYNGSTYFVIFMNFCFVLLNMWYFITGNIKCGNIKLPKSKERNVNKNARKVLEKNKQKVIKYSNRKPRKKWWIITTKKYTIPLYLLPISLFIIPVHELSLWIDKQFRVKCDEEKCKKALDKLMPRILVWSIEDEYYYTQFRICSCPEFEKYAPIGMKRFAKNCSYQLRNYLVDKYEMEGFTKKIERDYDWYHVEFKENVNTNE